MYTVNLKFYYYLGDVISSILDITCSSRNRLLCNDSYEFVSNVIFPSSIDYENGKMARAVCASVGKKNRRKKEKSQL